MKTVSVIAVALGLACTEVVAFPAMAAGAAKRELEKLERSGKGASSSSQRQKRLAFDPATQYVSTTGNHTFVPPNFSAGDQRGPCPGLNAAANHGYIDHSGADSMQNIINGVNSAYGMSLDLGTFLAVYGAVFDGNGLGYSIGGPTSRITLPAGNVLGLVGTPEGLSGSHNKYEADTSPTRGDLYLNGNDYKVITSQFQMYYDALVENVPAQTQYDNLIDFRIARYNNSLQKNPYFFFSPFAGVLVSPAGYSFPPRMMSNKSAEFPSGMLSKANLMSFFSITGESGNFVYTEGHERIPDNWYKLAIGDEYTIAGFLEDVVDFAQKFPPLLNVGGNTGTPNSFTPVDIGSLTHGAYSAASLLEGNNLECFLYQSITAATPDVAKGVAESISTFLEPVNNMVAEAVASLGCPQLQAFDEDQFKSYPGFTSCSEGCGSY